MKSASKVSIILPVFNAERYLCKALDSALNQTHENLEVVASDNNSTDNTFRILQEYAARDARVKVSRNDANIGWLLNLNKTVELATGDYIEIFGHDDVFEPTCIEEMASILDANPNVMVVTTTRNWIDADGNVIQLVRKFDQSKLLSGTEAIKSTVGPLENWISAPAMFRSALKGRGFNPHIPLYADLDYWCGMLKHGDLYYLDKALFNYRIHDQSGTSHMMKNMVFGTDLLRMVDRYSEYFVNEGETADDICKRVGRKLIDWGEHVVCHLSHDITPLVRPSNTNLDAWPLSESEQKTVDAHDCWRAMCLAVAEAGRERRAQRQAIESLEAAHRAQLAEERAKLENELSAVRQELAELRGSSSWRITAPLRRAVQTIKGTSSDPRRS